MSVLVMGHCFRIKFGNPYLKAVAVALADHADDDGSKIWPSVAALADKTELSERTVQYKLRDLEAAGLIELVDQGGRGPKDTREYKFNMRLLRKLSDGELDFITLKGAGDASLKGATDAPMEALRVHPVQLRVQATTEKGAFGAPEPSVNHQEPSVVARERAEAAAAKPKIDFKNLHRRLIEAGGDALNRTSANLEIVSDPIGWIEGGADLELDILPVLRAKASRAKPQSIRHWRYFADAVAEAVQNRKRGLPAVAQPEAPPVFRVSPETVRFAKPNLDDSWLHEMRAKNERRAATC